MSLRAFVAVLGVALVACVNAPAATPGTAVERLATRYAPVVRLSEQQEPCGGGESFEPIDVNVLFGREDVTLDGKPRPRASDLAGGHSGSELDFPGNPLRSSVCSYEQWQRRITAGRPSAVYAHVAGEIGRAHV